MALSDWDFERIDETSLNQLISSGAQEGALIEYKEETYGGSDSDKREFLKDLTSFGNTLGGHLVLGMVEATGVPTSLRPFTGDIDDELQRLENLARDCVEPRIGGIRMKGVPIAAGGHVIVIRVPRSWNVPHRATLKGSSRFYGRTSAGAYELGVEELRSRFNSSASAFDRALQFRERRLALIESQQGVVPLASDAGWLAMHIVPLGSTGEPIVDLEQAKNAAGQLLAPIGATGWSPEFNFDGFANIRSGERVFGYTQLFRDGSIEATKVRITATHSGVARIPALDVCKPIIKAAESYLRALHQLGVGSPLAIMITLVGVKGAYLGYGQNQVYEEPAIIRQNVLPLPAIVIGAYGDDISYHRALRPAFDALWNAGGLPHCTYFDADGRWQPHN